MTPATNNGLKTKRQMIGQITMCSGYCCSGVSWGKPEVPVEWLKQEWRTRGLIDNIQLTISCCLGPCDLPNVVRISGASAEIWLGNIDRLEQYISLVDWAERSKTAASLIPLPERFERLRFDPFRSRSEA